MTTIDRFSDEYRRTHLGASEWAAACGLSSYKAPIDLWAEKVGEADPFAGDAITALGQDLEVGIVANAARRLGIPVARTGQTIEMGPGALSFACATPDAWLVGGDLLQAKAPQNIGKASAEWGDDGTDEIPEEYVVQVTGEMAVARGWAKATGATPPERVHVAALLPREGMIAVGLFVVQWDPDLAAMLWERVRAFWRCVEEKRPPPLDASESYTRHLAKRYPKVSKEIIESDAAMDAAAHDFIKAQADLEDAESRKTYARNRMQERIAGAYGIRGPWGSASWYGVRGDAVVDITKARALLVERMGTEGANAAIASCMTEPVIDRARLVEVVQRLAPSKAEADRLVEACCTRGAGHRQFKLTPKKAKETST